MSSGKVVGAIAVGLAVAGFLVGAGKVAVHYARNVREATAVSEISHSHSLARAWLGERYAENGIYPRELPGRIEYGGKWVEIPGRQYLRYEVSEKGDRCGISWSFGRYACSETWENDRMTERTTEGFGGPDGR